MHTGFNQLCQEIFGDFVVGIGQHFASFFANNIVSNDAGNQKIIGDENLLDSGFRHLANVLGSDPLILGDNNLSGFVQDIKLGHFTAQTLGNDFKLNTLLR